MQPGEADFLVEATTLVPLLLYLDARRPPVPRLPKLLTRLAGTRPYLAALLQRRFPLLVVRALIRRECHLRRFSPVCAACAEKSRVGCEIIAELVAQVETPFGAAVLDDQLASGDEEQRRYMMMMGLTLLRHIDRRQRFYARYDPINLLLQTLASTLIDKKAVGDAIHTFRCRRL